MGNELPEEITKAIKTEANEIYWQTHKISKERDPYCMGLTMFEVAQVPLIEALTAKQLKYDELQAQAQCMAEDIQLMLDQFALNPELSWFDIAHKMKGIGLDALRQFKDGKGKEVVKEVEYMPILTAELRELKNIPDVPLRVPMHLLNDKQAYSNHGQSLQRLKERGGLSVKESLSLINCKSWMYYKDLSIKEAVDILNELITNPTK